MRQPRVSNLVLEERQGGDAVAGRKGIRQGFCSDGANPIARKQKRRRSARSLDEVGDCCSSLVAQGAA
eukprot:CAMPEP_0169471752 /NCGR_PEP_ID=MMETSP1042-20121227/24771_1 /TAXON_ID=464988 /ORGANISM="Hemiselmis andersenii, Strain CCMP1180" /LENGTH=67 /DNA_ID=CAMNT_0009585497 /DNA_START=604 /DNA_END=807 /DNA_ORIENTATION=+